MIHKTGTGKAQITFFLASLLSFCLSQTAQARACPSSAPEVTNKIQKHFDSDKDRCLNRYEYSLYLTHRRFGWELAKKKNQRPYDFNHDLMLEPFEMQMYLKDKEMGTLRESARKTGSVVPGTRGKIRY